MWSNQLKAILALLFVMVAQLKYCEAAMSMKQFEQSLQAMRKACQPKSGADLDAVDGLRNGKFPDDDRKLKCYTLCIFEMSGVLSKKKEIVEAKARSQAQIMLPKEMQEDALKAFVACSPVQKQYKDACDRAFYSVKCTYDFNPNAFMFP